MYVCNLAEDCINVGWKILHTPKVLIYQWKDIVYYNREFREVQSIKTSTQSQMQSLRYHRMQVSHEPRRRYTSHNRRQ